MGEAGDKIIWRVFTIIFVVVIFLLGTIGILIFVYLSVKYRLDEPESSNEYQRFHITHYDPTLDHTSSGIVNINEELEEGEYITYYEEENGIHVLISNFETSDYKCTGSCFCDTNIEGGRKSSPLKTVNLLKNGLIFLLSATSLSMAIQKGKIKLEDECNSIFKDEIMMCPKDSIIVSEIDECDSIRTSMSDIFLKNKNKENKKMKNIQELYDTDTDGIYFEESTTTGDQQQQQQQQKEKEEDFYLPDEGMKFMCFGYCLPRYDMKDDKDLSKECKEMELEKEEIISPMMLEMEGTEYEPGYWVEMIRFMFEKYSLKPFCKENSYQDDTCVGSYFQKPNPSVICNKL